MHAHNTMAATALLMVLIGSMLPAAFAQGASARGEADVSVTAGQGRIGVSADSEAEIDASTSPDRESQDQERAAQDRQKERQEREKAREQRKEERIQERQERMNERSLRQTEQAERMKDRFAQIRARQEERIKAAKEQCGNAQNPEACTMALDARLTLVAKLEEKDLDLLKQLQEKREERQANLAQLKNNEALKKYKEHDARARLVAHASLESARKRFLEAKEKEQEARKRFKEQKDGVKDLREKARAQCKDNLTAQACLDARAAVAAKAQATLLHAADAALETLTKVSTKISESEDLTDQEEAELKAKLDAHVKALADAKASIEALGSSATAADVEARAKDLRAVIAKAKEEGKNVSTLLVAFRMGGVIVQSKHLEARLTAVLEKATEKGKDISAVDSQVDAFHAKLEAAASAHAKARASLLAGNLAAGQASMKEAKARLEESRSLVKAIFKALQDQDLDEELQAQDIEADVKAAASATASASVEGGALASGLISVQAGGDQP